MPVDLNRPEFFQNPYPWYARLRAEPGPYWLPHEQDSFSDGVQLFSRYADARSLFQRVDGISKEIRLVRPPGRATAFDLHMLHRDGDDHLRLRRLVSSRFSAQHLRSLEPEMEAVADRLIQDMAGNDQADLMARFSEPMPLYVIAGVLGVPREDMPSIRQWSLDLGEGFDSVRVSEDVRSRQRKALASLLDYVRSLIRDRPARVRGGLVDDLVGAVGTGSISEEELVAMVGFLLFAGHETTINLIGNGLWLLLNDNRQRRALAQDPSLMPAAVEEILRYESPEQRTSFRVVTNPLDVNGVRVEPGQQVGVIMGAANRDEMEFPDPDRFDIRRVPNRHLAFGYGRHNCLGKTLARLEARIALQRIIARFPDMELLDEAPRWRTNSFFRGLTALNVRLADPT